MRRPSGAQIDALSGGDASIARVRVAALPRRRWPNRQTLGVIRFFRDVGFTLAEIHSFLAAGEQRSRQEIINRKLAEFTEQQHRLEVARELLEHGRRCPAGDPLRCSRFWSILDGRRDGLSLEDSHARVH